MFVAKCEKLHRSQLYNFFARINSMKIYIGIYIVVVFFLHIFYIYIFYKYIYIFIRILYIFIELEGYESNLFLTRINLYTMSVRFWSGRGAPVPPGIDFVSMKKTQHLEKEHLSALARRPSLCAHIYVFLQSR